MYVLPIRHGCFSKFLFSLKSPLPVSSLGHMQSRNSIILSKTSPQAERMSKIQLYLSCPQTVLALVTGAITHTEPPSSRRSTNAPTQTRGSRWPRAATTVGHSVYLSRGHPAGCLGVLAYSHDRPAQLWAPANGQHPRQPVSTTQVKGTAGGGVNTRTTFPCPQGPSSAGDLPCTAGHQPGQT